MVDTFFILCFLQCYLTKALYNLKCQKYFSKIRLSANPLLVDVRIPSNKRKCQHCKSNREMCFVKKYISTLYNFQAQKM